MVADMTSVTPSMSLQSKPKRARLFGGGGHFESKEMRDFVSHICVVLIVCLDFTGISLQVPLTFFYVMNYEDSQEMDVGLATALFGISYTIGQFLATGMFGFASDRMGRKPLLLFSVVAGVACYVGQGLAVNFKMLLILRFLTGISGGSRPVATAYFGDAIPAHRLPKWIAGFNVSLSMCLFISPAIGGSMGMISLALPCFFQAGVSAIVAFASFVYLREPSRGTVGASKTANSSAQVPLKSWRLWLLANAVVGAAGMFLIICWQTLFPILASAGYQLDQNQVGLLMAGGGMMLGLAQFTVFVPLSKRISVASIGCFGALLAGAPFALTFLPKGEVWCIAMVNFLHAFGVSLVMPAVTIITNLVTPPARRGSSNAMTMLAQSFARIIAPVVGGMTFDIDPALPLVIVMAVASAAFVCDGLLSIVIPATGKVGDKKKDEALSKEEQQERDEQQEILENLYKVHRKLIAAEKGWESKRHDLKLGKTPAEVGLEAEEFQDHKATEEEKNELRDRVVETFEAHGYKTWHQHMDFFMTMFQNAFPKIRNVEWSARADDILYIIRSHLVLEQRWERFVLSGDDLADLPEYDTDAAPMDELLAGTRDEVRGRADREGFQNLSLTICPNGEVAYV